MPGQNQPTEAVIYPRAVLGTKDGSVIVGPLPFRPGNLDVRIEINERRSINIVARDDGRVEVSFLAGYGGGYLIKPVAGNCFDLIPVED